MKTIRKVAVVGGGTMGRQIALNAAISGYETKVTDTIPAVRENVRKWAEDYLAGRIAKGKMTEEQVADIKARFRVTDDLAAAVKDVDVVIRYIMYGDIKGFNFKNADVNGDNKINAADIVEVVNIIKPNK